MSSLCFAVGFHVTFFCIPSFHISMYINKENCKILQFFSKVFFDFQDLKVKERTIDQTKFQISMYEALALHCKYVGIVQNDTATFRSAECALIS